MASEVLVESVHFVDPLIDWTCLSEFSPCKWWLPQTGTLPVPGSRSSGLPCSQFHRVVPGFNSSELASWSMVSTLNPQHCGYQLFNLRLLTNQGNIRQVPCNCTFEMRWPHTQTDDDSVSSLHFAASMRHSFSFSKCAPRNLHWMEFGSNHPTLSSSHFLFGFAQFHPMSF